MTAQGNPVKLGERYRDRLSGFTGHAIDRTEYLAKGHEPRVTLGLIEDGVILTTPTQPCLPESRLVSA